MPETIIEIPGLLYDELVDKYGTDQPVTSPAQFGTQFVGSRGCRLQPLLPEHERGPVLLHEAWEYSSSKGALFAIFPSYTKLTGDNVTNILTLENIVTITARQETPPRIHGYTGASCSVQFRFSEGMSLMAGATFCELVLERIARARELALAFSKTISESALESA